MLFRRAVHAVSETGRAFNSGSGGSVGEAVMFWKPFSLENQRSLDRENYTFALRRIGTVRPLSYSFAAAMTLFIQRGWVVMLAPFVPGSRSVQIAAFGRQELADAMGQANDAFGEFLMKIGTASETNGRDKPPVIGLALMHAAPIGIETVGIRIGAMPDPGR